MYARQLHVIVHRHLVEWDLHSLARDLHLHLVETPYDNMLDCVAMYCNDDCIGNHRQYQEHLPAMTSMTYGETEISFSDNLMKIKSMLMMMMML